MRSARQMDAFLFMAHFWQSWERGTVDTHLCMSRSGTLMDHLMYFNWAIEVCEIAFYLEEIIEGK